MQKYAVITGASSGIGKEFAKQLDQKNYHLLLIARREERLKALAQQLSSHCEIIKADLSIKEECERVYQMIQDKDIEIFINNAGFGDCGSFIDGNLEKELQMINVNIQAVHIFTKYMIQYMQKRGHGYLLNVASSAGLTPGGPYMATYYATKAYVTSLTLAIQKELCDEHSHVYIGCLCPGPVNSEFNQVADVQFALKGISCEKCVRYALKKMFSHQTIIIPTFKMKIAMTLGKFLPISWYISITAHQQKKKLE